MKEQDVRDTVLVVCGAASFILLFWFLNVYVIPWARDYISYHYGVTYLPHWGHIEFSLIEGVLCILLGIASLVMRYFVGMFDPPLFWALGINRDYNTRVERRAFLKSTISVLTGISLIIAGIILAGFSIDSGTRRVWYFSTATNIVFI